jgi:hypothetical protein
MLGFLHVLAIVNNIAMYIGTTDISKTMPLIFLGMYPEVKLLDHMVILFLIFWRAPVFHGG